MKFKTLTGFFAVATLLAVGMMGSVAYAGQGINVAPMIIHLNRLHRYEDILVYNEGATNAYVEATVSQEVELGTKQQHQVDFTPGEDPSSFGLLASPSKLIIPGHQMRKIRVYDLFSKVSTDHFYSIVIKPVEPEIEAMANPKHHLLAYLNIVVAYSPLVIINPYPTHYDIQVNMTPSGDLTIKNAGNSYVSFHDGKQCRSQGGCKSLPYHVLYAGTTWHVTLPYGANPAQYKMISAQGLQSITITPSVKTLVVKSAG